MADNDETETKEKRTVPGLERSFKGIIAHTEKVMLLVFNKERTALTNPTLAISALFGWIRTLAALVHESLVDLEARLEGKRVSDLVSIDSRATTLEKRVEAIEGQLTTAENAGVAMMKAMMDGTSPIDVIKQLGNAEPCACGDKDFPTQHTKRDHTLPRVRIPAAVPVPDDSSIVSAVVPLKPDKNVKKSNEKSNEKHDEPKGGAA